MRIQVKVAEEAKGRKYQDEGRVGRKEESLESEGELPEDPGRKDAEDEVGERGVDAPEVG